MALASTGGADVIVSSDVRHLLSMHLARNSDPVPHRFFGPRLTNCFSNSQAGC